MFKHDKVETVLAIAAVVILSLIAVASVASTKTAVTLGKYELRNDQNVAISKHNTQDDCIAAAAKAPGEYRCITQTKVSVIGVCDMPAPAPPPQTDAWAVQLTDTEWTTEVPGWVPATYEQGCWVIGRVPLVYDENADNGSAQIDNESGPWIEGVDYPLGTPCPEAAHGNCAASPRAPS